MNFKQFSQVLETIEHTSMRNEMTKELARLFGNLKEDEVNPACWLMLGRIYPQYEGVEFQFAEKMMIRAVATAFEVDAEVVVTKYKDSGDLGETAQSLAKHENTNQSIVEVFENLRSLAGESGGGSQERKLALMVELLRSLDQLSVRYIVRIVLGKLRLGFSDMTILDALSWAKLGDKSDRPILEEAYQNKHDIGKLAAAYIGGGEKSLLEFGMELGIPIQPALCQRLKTPDEMISKMGKVIVESKYDGTRVQIHISQSGDWKVRTFTRSMEESSNQFPELKDNLADFENHDLILDAEAIGYDPASGKFLPFQETIQRKRKHGVEEYAKKIPLKFFVFDLLYLDGESLLVKPLNERKEKLHQLLQALKADSVFIESKYIVTESPEELRDFHKQQLSAGLEGAVVKQFSSPYQPGRKGFYWVKFKEEETSKGKLSDTIDAVVMGYWYGKGKRTGFGVGAFLIGIKGEEDKILTLTKVGTGLSDEQWRELKTRSGLVVATEKPASYSVDKLLIPDVWLEPQIVVEVAGDELTKSPNHSAGLALRFPRLVRFRDDKSVDQITTKSELASIK